MTKKTVTTTLITEAKRIFRIAGQRFTFRIKLTNYHPDWPCYEIHVRCEDGRGFRSISQGIGALKSYLSALRGARDGMHIVLDHGGVL